MGNSVAKNLVPWQGINTQHPFGGGTRRKTNCQNNVMLQSLSRRKRDVAKRSENHNDVGCCTPNQLYYTYTILKQRDAGLRAPARDGSTNQARVGPSFPPSLPTAA